MMKYLLAGSVSAGLTLFFWGAFSHTALPLPEPVNTFTNPQAVMDAVTANTKGDGVYFEPRGVFLALKMRPAGASPDVDMGPYLGVELATNLLTGLLLALLFARLQPMSMGGYALTGFVTGLIAFTAISLSLWNWYGFSAQLTAQDMLDTPLGFTLAGVVLARLRRWISPITTK